MAGVKGRSGRKKGSKNVTHSNDGAIINQYGVKISVEQQREIRRLNAKIAYQRKVAENKASVARNYELGEASFLYNPEKGVNEILFKPRKITISPSQFTSQAELSETLRKANLDTSKLGVHLRIQTYKDNYKKAMQKSLGNEPSAYGLIQENNILLNEISDEMFVRMTANGTLPSINYVYYDPNHNKLRTINSALRSAVGYSDVNDYDEDELDF